MYLEDELHQTVDSSNYTIYGRWSTEHSARESIPCSFSIMEYESIPKSNITKSNGRNENFQDWLTNYLSSLYERTGLLGILTLHPFS